MYPKLYHAHHSHHQEDISFWLEEAAQTGDPILELGCGTGRVLLTLAKAGHRVIGIDHDLSMIKYLRENFKRQSLPSTPAFVADICEFQLGMRFPLIIVPCNTYSTLDKNERAACLRCVRNHLPPGGIFVVSVPNPDLLSRLPAKSDVEYEEEIIHPQTGNPVQISSSWQRGRGIFSVSWIYDHLLPDGTVERLVMKTGHHLASVDTYQQEFRSAGLEVLAFYGDFDRSEFHPDSPQLIIKASAVSINNPR